MPLRPLACADKSTWLSQPDSGICISYADPVSIKLKPVYVQEHVLGGIMFWELSGDDAQGNLINRLLNGLKILNLPSER